MILFDQLVSVFAPHHCQGCVKEGSLLCSMCRTELLPHPMVCVRCHRLSPGFRTCHSCRQHQAARRVFIASRYEGVLRQVVKQFKYQRAMGATEALAPILLDALPPEEWDIVVPVPSTTRRLRLRGYNPAGLLAQKLGSELDIPFTSALGRQGQVRQVGAKRTQRLTQLEKAMYVRQDVSGLRILLVDDIVTTGATIHVCARALRDAGARSVDAVVLARHIS